MRKDHEENQWVGAMLRTEPLCDVTNDGEDGVCQNTSGDDEQHPIQQPDMDRTHGDTSSRWHRCGSVSCEQVARRSSAGLLGSHDESSMTKPTKLKRMKFPGISLPSKIGEETTRDIHQKMHSPTVVGQLSCGLI